MKKSFTAKLTAGFIAAACILSACGSGNVSSATKGAAAGAASSAKAGTVAATQAAANTKKSDETIVVALAAEPSALTPLNGIVTNAACYVADAMGSRLFSYDLETGKLENELAEKVEKVDDSHYKITLRSDAKYSDGTPVKAADVVYTYKTCNAAGCDYANKFDISGFQVVDDHTVIIAYKQYVPGWDIGLAEANATIFSEDEVNKAGGLSQVDLKPPVQSGKYNFVEWKSGEYILLERNENYWNKDYAGYYKNIKFIFIPDAASRLMAVKSGDANVSTDISVSAANTNKSDSATDTQVVSYGRVYNMYYNNSDGIFKDEKVREAVSYLVDSQGINALTTMGQGKAVQGFIPSNNKFYKEVYPGGIHTYDVNKAKELLSAAGYPNGFSCKCITLPVNQATCTIIQEQLRKGGVEMNISPLEQGVYVKEAKAGNYDIAVGNNDNSSLSPDNFALINPAQQKTTIGGCKITDPAMTELIKKASSSDEATAKQGWSDIEDYVFGKYSLVGLCDSPVCYVTTKGLKGVSLTKRGFISVTNASPSK